MLIWYKRFYNGMVLFVGLCISNYHQRLRQKDKDCHSSSSWRSQKESIKMHCFPLHWWDQWPLNLNTCLFFIPTLVFSLYSCVLQIRLSKQTSVSLLFVFIYLPLYLVPGGPRFWLKQPRPVGGPWSHEVDTLTETGVVFKVTQNTFLKMRRRLPVPLGVLF